MTNKEKYKKAFSVLHASNTIDWEAKTMANRKNQILKKVLAASTAIVLVSGSMTAAYAADIGGIRQKLTMWLHGEQTEVTAKDNGDYSYKYTYTDPEGNKQEFVAGGVTIDDFGNEHPISAQEILDEFTDEVIHSDTGKIYLYYFEKDQKIDITDLLNQKGRCQVAVKDGKKTAYFTIQENGDGDFEFEKTFETPEDEKNYTFIE